MNEEEERRLKGGRGSKQGYEFVFIKKNIRIGILVHGVRKMNLREYNENIETISVKKFVRI